MRVLVCPDKFAGTLSAVEAAEAIEAGWRAGAPRDEVTLRPLADGGPGFLEVLAQALDGNLITVPTVDPLGRRVTGQVLLVGDTAYVESAQACGLHLLERGERDPKITTSFGLGPLVTTAVEAGARRVVIGLGGSATNDAGGGFLAALDAAPLDADGYALPFGGAALAACDRLAGPPKIRDGVTLVAATDVDNPLVGIHGASAVYGPQKGATREDVQLLDIALERFADVLQKEKTCPPGLAALPGAGAAGGLGAVLLALGGERISGINLVRDLMGLDAQLDQADLVITGEGSFDHQSLRGKLVAGVAAAARERGVPCLVVAGQVSAGRREAAMAGIEEAYALVDEVGPEDSMRRAGPSLRRLAQRLAGQWSR
ncbi:glycerate kinase [Virgisporangium aliadipatigenens]|uniref:Glycerate kinase n=1 Tax=Virgisporangium aliadipatigenens TaxID=741659 RepID=A0A8J3YRH7_9ACTN|nr:glycerate kinase [Virgisporangium aliadipatigenens]GIJ50509.1 glycerate kinase [Virgisporangium aliadipatigenens]